MMGTTINPPFAAAAYMSIHSTQLYPRAANLSPFFKPISARAFASRQARSFHG